MTFFARVPNLEPRPPMELPVIRIASRDHPRDYLPDEGLVDAVNVALLLGQPLLVTGEPGCGKTQLAGAVAWQLGLPLHRFDAKSDSRARDLFYTYDSLGHFRSPGGAQSDARPWITWSALGRAILAANPAAAVEDLTEDATNTRSVVLIDEIDKAPRDFPNDLLAEIENLYFRIPELRNRTIQAPPDRRPVVIVTSNSERALPDAFLRRCAYYHIPFPDPEKLAAIVTRRLESAFEGRSALLDVALGEFSRLRALQPPLRKPPSTAELLSWLRVLSGFSDDHVEHWPAVVRRTIPALLKTQEDLERALELLPE